MASLGIIANYTHTLSTHISMCLHEHAAHLHQRVDWHRAAHVQLTSMLKQNMLIQIFFYSSVGSADKRTRIHHATFSRFTANYMYAN